ncbi:MAG: PHP domain-containing protein [Bacilli bacterium]|nr:PHP domain-containing protein [Bacilli bacterium]
MVDMHIHTLYSDGDKTLEEVLISCEEKHLDYISITDHNNCEGYKDNIWKKKIYTGKIVCGVEMNAFLDNGKRIELLGYNIKNTNIINEWSQQFYSEKVLKDRFIKDKQKIIDICNKNHFIYDIDAIKKDIPYTDFYVVYMYYELIKYPENIEKMGECAKSFNDFRKLGLSNPKSIFYMGEDNSSKPMFRDVANIIHQAGGLVFLAHPFEYKFEDTIGFINKLRTKIKLDGIECFHPSAMLDNRINLLVEYAKKNNLFISGGSDYHGDKKTNNDIGMLNIPNNYIEEWVETI